MEVLIGVVHMVLKVALPTIPLVLSIEELNMVLRVLLAHVIEPHVKASELLRKKMMEWVLSEARGSDLISSSRSRRELWQWTEVSRSALHGTPTARLGAIISSLNITLTIKVIIIALVGFIGDGGVEGIRQMKEGLTMMVHPHLAAHHGEDLYMHTTL